MQNKPPSTTRRKPFDAVTLSALLPGLGHIYMGEFRAGILWIATTVSIMIAAVVSLILNSTRGGITIAVALIGVDLLLSAVCAIKVWRLARRRKGEDYVLRDYNRWYVYVVLFFACSMGSAIGLAFILREHVVQAFAIPTASMQPTINVGDRIIALKKVYLQRNPERGELVVFRGPEDRRMQFVKRVIALAGDEIEWQENGDVFVNGAALQHSPSNSEGILTETNGTRQYQIRHDGVAKVTAGKATVPPHHCFVLGDNRFLSKDSRYLGPISYSALDAQPVATFGFGVKKLE